MTKKVPESFIKEIVSPACCGDERIIEAFREFPRISFISDAISRSAYTDNALPIGFGQTISKPSTVAAMLHALKLTGNETVLEIGTGSGFQTALLSKLAKRVYTVERIRDLFLSAMTIVKRHMGFNVMFKLDDGHLGWPDNAPFDRIIAAAEAREMPELLTGQLKDGGIMLLPLKGRIIEFVKEGDSLKETDLGPCSFVDFVREKS